MPSPTDASKRRQAGGWQRFVRMPSSRRREFLRIEIKYTGGSECWYLVKARGSWGRFPGYASLHDVMNDVYNDAGDLPSS